MITLKYTFNFFSCAAGSCKVTTLHCLLSAPSSCPLTSAHELTEKSFDDLICFEISIKHLFQLPIFLPSKKSYSLFKRTVDYQVTQLSSYFG